MSGLTSYHAGLAAEASVARDYTARGYQIASTRFKTASGEIDLIARKDDRLIFVEVKKSRSFAKAAAALSQRQMMRIYTAASEFLAGEPKGQESDARFDVALVNGEGQIDIVENAIFA